MMVVIRKVWSCVAMFCLVACGAAGEDRVTFSGSVAPIFFASCNYCHHQGNATGVDLTHPFDPTTGIVGRANSWTSASAKLVVDPGNLTNSFLIHKLEREDLDAHIEGNRMPWNIERLTADEIAAIRQWITDGAKDDGFFQASVAPIFGDGVSLASRGGKCSYCHYPGTPQPPDLTHPFDATTGVVNVASVRGGGKRVVPGDPSASVLVKKVEAPPGTTSVLGSAMPLQISLLSQAQIATIKVWITDGAKND
jgi:hypothetical protein